MYVRPTMILSGLSFSEGLAATIASRFVLVLAPMNLPASFESVSPASALYSARPLAVRPVAPVVAIGGATFGA
jgi:hypothetical protein